MEKWICTHKSFHIFTYGKVYEGVAIGNTKPYLLDIVNDFGDKCYPCLSGVDSNGEKIMYFKTIDQWRIDNIDTILN